MARKPKAAKPSFNHTRHSRLVALFFIVVTICELGWLNFWKGNAPTGWGVWVFGDWFWNFGGGFVRRGLGGELLILLHNITRIPIVNLLHLLLTALTVVFNLASYRLVRGRFSAEALAGKAPTLPLLLAVTSPMVFAYSLAVPMVIGHKELLVFCLFLWWLRLLRLELPRRELLWFALAVGVVELTNEMLMFFSVYFAAAFLFTYATKDERRARFKQVAIPVGVLAFTSALAVMFSTNSSQTGMCDRITAAGAPVWACTGPLEWGGHGAKSAAAELAYQLNLHPFFPVYGAALLVSLLPLWLLVRKASRTKFLKIAMLVAIVAVAPMFAVAQDWGRWVSIHAVLATLFVLGLVLPAEPAAAVKPKRGAKTAVAEKPKGLDRIPVLMRYVLALVWLVSWGVLHYGAQFSSIYSVYVQHSFDDWLQPR